MVRVVVKGANWLGEAVMSIPALAGIKKVRPGAHVTVLTKENLAPLYESVPEVDATIPYRSTLTAVRRLRREKFDACLIIPRSFKSALMTALGKIPVRIGYAADSRSMLLTVPVPRSRETLRTHRVYYYFNLLRGFAPTPPIPAPRLRVTGEANAWCDSALAGAGINGRRLVGINPGAAYGAAKRWFPDRFIEVGRRLVKNHDVEILVFGGPSEKDLATEITRGIGIRAHNFGGNTSIPQLIALIDRCALFVTNDTGPMHVADALGRPIVAIFGSTDWIATRPFGKRHILIRHEIDCAPCLKRVCPLKHHHCMDWVSVNEVVDACRQLLDRRAI